ncbi:hypothetical protein AKJ16_DCAP04632 [Drosera capensis]
MIACCYFIRKTRKVTVEAHQVHRNICDQFSLIQSVSALFSSTSHTGVKNFSYDHRARGIISDMVMVIVSCRIAKPFVRFGCVSCFALV